MSEIKSLAAPKASFDRRTVVKTAAWSVPVIAAAIAAPAAAASTTTAAAAASTTTATAAASFAKAPAGATFTRVENPVPGQNRSGLAPAEFTIKNTSTVPTGTIQGFVTIQPVTTGATGVGFETTTPTAGAAGSFSGNVFTAPIFYSIGLAGGASQIFNLGGFKYLGAKLATGGKYAITVTLTHPAAPAASSEITLT
ncbi:hypothetical protein [Arthrobacter sp. U41]|uniref:hypothetical protein n=1 Tax=Arthrobacter sp. U41 TaxID=1849032 RepID=UPI0012F80636|nr:hypothetical protein [Arthrobacter sp. U41]